MHHTKEKKLYLYLIANTVTNTRWVKDLNRRLRTIETLEEGQQDVRK